MKRYSWKFGVSNYLNMCHHRTNTSTKVSGCCNKLEHFNFMNCCHDENSAVLNKVEQYTACDFIRLNLNEFDAENVPCCYFV